MPALNVTALVDAWEREIDLACPCCQTGPTWGEFLVNVVEDHERFEPSLRSSATTVLLSLVRDVTVPN